MTSDDGIDVVLTWLNADLGDLAQQASDDLAQARETEDGLGDLEARGAALRRRLGLDLAQPEPASLWSARLGRPSEAAGASPEWEDLRRQAEQSLRSRGVDPSSVDLDDLLDPEEVRRIERRFLGGFTVQAHLDRYDVLIILIAGLTAAAVDYFLMGAPLSLTDLRRFTPDDSPLTAFLHGLSTPSDNPMSRMAHAPFDAQRHIDGSQIAGFRPATHRDLTLGHDPLLGIVFGTRDIMTGQLTTFGSQGQLVILPTATPPVPNLLFALQTEITHLLSDAFTPAGLPAPGWTALNALPYGSFGPQGQTTLAGGALDMYTKGYDSRHFLTMGTSVVAAELVLRAYWSVRIARDPEYAEDIAREAEIACSRHVADHPRYQALAFGAHAFAAAANAGKVVLAQNPLLINYPQWQRFVLASFQLAQGRAVSPTEVLIRRGRGNAEAIACGWPDLDADDPSFPVADLRTES